MDVTQEPSLEELLNAETNANKLVPSNMELLKRKRKKRANKNRPREESSKIPINQTYPIKSAKKITVRDPRFDTLCGTYSEKRFREDYGFIEEIRKREEHELRKCLSDENDPVRKKHIEFLLKRMKDQKRENDRKIKKEAKKIEQCEKIKKTLREGKPVHFKTKSEKKIAELVEKYGELKSNGKLENYLKKKLKDKKKHKEIPFR